MALLLLALSACEQPQRLRLPHRHRLRREVSATVEAGVGPRGIAVHDGSAWVANTVSGTVATVGQP